MTLAQNLIKTLKGLIQGPVYHVYYDYHDDDFYVTTQSPLDFDTHHEDYWLVYLGEL